MNETNGSAFSEDLIRAELARVLQSPIFALSDRLGRFLRFSVEHAISGSEDGLKEYVIGTEVYDRKPPYHPSQDSIVRTEARRLRIKLKEYYESEGKDNPIFIYFRPGSYIPVFRPKTTSSCQEIEPGSPEEQVFVEGAGIPVAVIPFIDASGQPLSSEFARGVTDELVHELMQCEGVRVVATSSIAQSGSQAQDISALAQKLGVRIIFEGSVRLEGARVRVTSRMVSADGFQLWSQRFDAEAVPSSFFDVQEQFASALVNRVRPTQSIIRSGEASVGPVVLSHYPSLLKAEVWLEQGNESDVQCALTKFREIAQATKGYARPLYGVAQCYCWITLCGAPPSPGMVSLARNASEQAVELDPESSEALATKGSALALAWDWGGAEEAFRQAAKLGFCVSSARQFAMFLTLLGRFDDAWPYLHRAQLTDPFSYLQKAACAKFFYMTGRHQEAFELFSEPLKYGPWPLDVQLYLALIHANLGQFDEARRLAQLILRDGGTQMPLRAGVTEILARCGDDAAPMAHEHKLLAADAPLSRYRQALLSMTLGDSEGALSLLSRALEDKEAELPWLAVDPRFAPIRLNARFAEIVSKVRS
jgi:TolB-like protein/tetratricopeptide (TPR) repeat protein